MDDYWRVVKKSKGTIIVLTDDAANILKRITFYDKDSKPSEKHLTKEEKPDYLKEIQKDITYFNRTYKKADIWVHISGRNPDQVATKVKEMLDKHGQTRGNSE